MTPSAARRSAKGSFEPVGFSSDRQEADQRIDLVGERDGDATGAVGQRSLGPERRVVLGDRIGDRRRSRRRCQRVIAAHDALQLRELADHAGGEIGLGQSAPRGARRSASAPGRCAARSRRPASPSAPTLSATVPSLAWKTMAFSAGSRGFEPSLAVLVPEELGIGEARAQHALVAGDDGGAVVARSPCWRRRGSAAPAGPRRPAGRNISDACASRWSAPRAAGP